MNFSMQCPDLFNEWGDFHLRQGELPSAALLCAGVDEAGRGPLAGPVCAAAVILPPSYRNEEITDSKKLSSDKREELYRLITKDALGYAVAFFSAAQIDEHNIRQATRMVMASAAQMLALVLEDRGWNGQLHFKVDGNVPMATKLSQETIIRGDQTELAISAASILAKVTRDYAMMEADKLFPGYGFAQHKGYPTAYHKLMVKKLGPCPIHRLTFQGVREFAPHPATKEKMEKIAGRTEDSNEREQMELFREKASYT